MSEPKLKEIHDARGRLIIREWLIDDKLHRGDGPAWIEYDIHGEITEKSYYLNGMKLSEKLLTQYTKLNNTIREHQKRRKVSL